MKALYRLSEKIAGYDFFPWLVMQAQAGATEIVFDIRNPTESKWPADVVMRRFETLLWEGPPLIELKRSIGTDGNANLAPYHQRDLIRLARAGVKFPRIKSVLPAGAERYTVTLRNTQRVPVRNSDAAAWREFAAEIGARVIPDYEDEPLALHEMVALYAGAEMNFFVTNGPGLLCMLSPYPVMQFDLDVSPMSGYGVPYGEGYPWLLPNQLQIYESGDLPTIRKHFYSWANRCATTN